MPSSLFLLALSHSLFHAGGFGHFEEKTVAFDGPPPEANETTEVLVLGAGMSGLAAAKQLFDADIDFKIIEGNDRIGGRMRKATMSDNETVVEVGAQWITRPRGRAGFTDNPMWQLAQQINLDVTRSYWVYTDPTSGEYYDKDGNNVTNDADVRYDNYSAASECDWAKRQVCREAPGCDESTRDSLTDCGWTPTTALDEAIEWNGVDYGWAAPAEVVSAETFDSTYKAWGPGYGYVSDTRGFAALAEELAKDFIEPGCSEAGSITSDCNPTGADELRLSERVVRIERAEGGGVLVEVDRDGETYTYGAKYAIVSFSAGVLRRAVGIDGGAGALAFEPELPGWKIDAIGGFEMGRRRRGRQSFGASFLTCCPRRASRGDARDTGHYCKLFLEFDEKFWDGESFIYASADPAKQWPVWMSMNATYANQYPNGTTSGIPTGPEAVRNFAGKNVLVGTTTGAECVRVSGLSDGKVIDEAMGILQTIFGTLDDPIAHFVARWSEDEWTYGSYPYWTPGTLSWKSRTLEYPVDQVFFTGDATNARYPAYTHGAYLGGVHTAAMVLACLGKVPTFPMQPMEAEWEAFGVSCPALQYDEAAVRDAYYTEPYPTDQSGEANNGVNNFYYYYDYYYQQWQTP